MGAEVTIWLLLLIAAVAAIYASVGHGGASGYLAVLTLFGFTAAAMRPTALTLNLFVAGLAWLAFARAGHFSWKHLWPFAVASVPASFLGATLAVPPMVYSGLLAATLTVAALRLAWPPKGGEVTRPPALWLSLPLGAALGILSGITGVGGGIYLSPLLLLLRWASPKTTAAMSAAFIFVNSASGLLGHWLGGGKYPLSLLPLVGAAVVGGAIGSHIGARLFSGLLLRRVLAGVLVIAAYKLVATLLK